MKIKLNGDERQVPGDAAVTNLLVDLKLKPEQVAVEVNKRLVKSSDYDKPLHDGDEVEVVTFVGGG